MCMDFFFQIVNFKRPTIVSILRFINEQMKLSVYCSEKETCFNGLWYFDIYEFEISCLSELHIEKF